jgi:NAD(P)-dependent dehydrogenase (short-subunit alcohol dehydrogenase family)
MIAGGSKGLGRELALQLTTQGKNTYSTKQITMKVLKI